MEYSISKDMITDQKWKNWRKNIATASQPRCQYVNDPLSGGLMILTNTTFSFLLFTL